MVNVRDKMKMRNIDFQQIEKKWQKEWEKKKAFKCNEETGKKKFYLLEMFPYPSSTGLHMGHALNYSIGDVFARFKRMQGFNVLYPMGYDALGLPAENAAIKAGEHPLKYTENAIKNYIRQQKELGLSYDWSRIIETHKPDYYKWDQWIFLKMFEKGLAYRKKSPVNWCPKCQSVLANEQVQGGKCWRHEDTDVEIKHLEQWFLKITNYAEELYDSVDRLEDWPERIKAMQRNWIGKSHGTEILFDVVRGDYGGEGSKGIFEKWPIFTTRPDTLFGVTFMVVSSQHTKLMELVTDNQEREVERFLKKLKSVSEKELEETEKEGVFTGSYAINPINGEKVPIYAGNFVVADYGSGMVMAVPAHDQRDFEFAKKYKLPIKEVIKGGNTGKSAYTGEGVLINSKEFNGLNSEEAKEHIIIALKEKKLGKKTINYKLRDWLISRQRYWGTPIPIVYCEKCGAVPVKEKDLPVELPRDVKFGKGNPLTTNDKWIKVKCPKCNGSGKRETDTMDTFVNSSWYYLRYTDPKNNKEIFDKKKAKYWTPIDLYIGGAEHACLHLIYFRFYTKFLRDLKLLEYGEPAHRLFNQGMLSGEGGEKMSKSKGNVINPDEVSKKYGMDTARFFLLSLASPDKPRDWNEDGIEGSFRFMKKLIEYFKNVKIGKTDSKTESKLNKTIREVTNEIEDLRYNIAIIRIREIFDSLPMETSRDVLEKCLKLLSPFCPHITEEIWHNLGNRSFISLERWPIADEKKIDERFEEQEKTIEKLKGDIINIIKIVGKDKTKIYIYAIPNEVEIIKENKEILTKITGLEVNIYAVNDKDKYDPENRSKKAKPGSPGIFLE
ncbi:MAG: leucine--tRNA ligase [Nanoarchaeota archaeon]